MHCKYRGKKAIYKCNTCGALLCEKHAELRIACPSCIKHNVFKCKIVKMKKDSERKKIRVLVRQFWGEDEQLTFDRKFKIAELPAYVAKVKKIKLLDLFLLRMLVIRW